MSTLWLKMCEVRMCVLRSRDRSRVAGPDGAFAVLSFRWIQLQKFLKELVVLHHVADAPVGPDARGRDAQVLAGRYLAGT